MMTAVLFGRTGTGLMTRTEIGVAETRVFAPELLAASHVASPHRTGVPEADSLARRARLITETYLFANIALLLYYYFCLTAFCTCANRDA